MLCFASDYMDGAHEKVLEKLIKTNMEHLPGYGVDSYCQSAKEKLRHCAAAIMQMFIFWWAERRQMQLL